MLLWSILYIPIYMWVSAWYYFCGCIVELGIVVVSIHLKKITQIEKKKQLGVKRSLVNLHPTKWNHHPLSPLVLVEGNWDANWTEATPKKTPRDLTSRSLAGAECRIFPENSFCSPHESYTTSTRNKWWRSLIVLTMQEPVAIKQPPFSCTNNVSVMHFTNSSCSSCSQNNIP